MVYCEICGCTDIKYFGKRKGELYCRRCISFKGESVIKNNSSSAQEVKPMLKYKLTGDKNTTVTFQTRIKGLHDNITNITHTNIEAKSINKFKDLSLYRGSGCGCNYSYTVWYI